MSRFFGKETEVEKYSKLHVRLVYECANKLKDVDTFLFDKQVSFYSKDIKNIWS